MITRDQIYGQDAASLVRMISMYRVLTEKQITLLFPGKEKVLKNLLTHLTRQGRVYFNEDQSRYSTDKLSDSKADAGMIAAVWVLCDFIDRAEYHCSGDFPVKVSFFADGELYEIIHVPFEQEAIVSHALAGSDEAPPKRIVIVDKSEQISRINIPNTAGFCTVGRGGTVTYYKLE